MDAEEKGKILQNVTFMKERLWKLDHIIKRLIERDVFSEEHGAQIKEISKPTPHQLSAFIKLLVESPSRSAYEVFVETLVEAGYDKIANKLIKTTAKESHGRHLSLSAGSQRSISKAYKAPSPSETTIFEEQGAAAASSEQVPPKHGCPDCADAVKIILESLSEQQQSLLDNFRQKRRENISAFEERRLNDQNQTKEQMMQLCGQLKEEKEETIRENDIKISKLQFKVNELQRGSEELNFLKEKYEHLREKQKKLKEENSETRTILVEKNKENHYLRREKEKLESELNDARINLQNSEETNRNLEEDKRRRDEIFENLECEICILKRVIEQKDLENENLDVEVKKQCQEIEIMLKTQGTTNMENGQKYVRALALQCKTLNDIVETMKTIPSGKQPAQPKIDSRGKRLYGNVTNISTFGQRTNMKTKN